MDPMLPKAEQWINENKDPRSARWQAGIEAVMDLVSPLLIKGRLTPVCPLDDKDLPLFAAVLARVDLSPNLLAAFLPPRMADAILPPDNIEELIRIQKGKPSYKIIIQRPGKESRILCAEISEHAHRLGVDIFQSGAFLGNFDYDTHDICIAELPKAIRAHGWEKENWQQKDHLTYTVNWFEKIIYLGKADVTLDKTRSILHSPTLIRTDRIDALFRLLYQTLHSRFAADPDIPAMAGTQDKEDRESALNSVAETGLLDLLSLIKTCELLDFANFTNAEAHKFQTEFTRTVRKLSSDLDKLIPARPGA